MQNYDEDDDEKKDDDDKDNDKKCIDLHVNPRRAQNQNRKKVPNETQHCHDWHQGALQMGILIHNWYFCINLFCSEYM